MDAISIIRADLKQGHDIMEQAVAGLTPEQLHHRFEHSTIETIATIYAHTVMAEDWFMNGKIRGEGSLFQREGWADRVRIDMLPFGGDYAGWVATVTEADFAALREYAEKVYAETDCCLAGLSESDLNRTVTFVDEMPLGLFLGTVMSWHAIHHGGEICALKGVLGGKGLPF